MVILDLINPDSQKQLSIFFSPPACLLESWKEIYIPGFSVPIGGKEWYIDVKGDPSRVLLGFDEGFYEIKLELMEPQNQVRVENLFPDFYFQVFWRFSYMDGVGGTLPYP